MNLERSFSWLIVVILVVVWSCSSDDMLVPRSGSSTNSWLVPQEEVVMGAAKDAIISIDDPAFIAVGDVTYLRDEDRVLVLNLGDEFRVYPIKILDWHEIINDKIDQSPVAITYCPLTATGLCWSSTIDDIPRQFGVSGLLFHSNLIAYDRQSGSYWSQVRLDCINGRDVGRSLRPYPLIDLSWKAVQNLAPDASVLSDQTGFDLPYESYPYGDYQHNDDFFISPVDFEDQRLRAKDKVVGIVINNVARVYPSHAFPEDEVTISNHVFNGQPLVMISDPKNEFIVAYKSNVDGTVQKFSLDWIDDALGIVDEQGRRFNIFGQQINGSMSLGSLRMFVGYWFAWTKFYPRVEIYEL